MKKILFTLVLLATSTYCFGQSNLQMMAAGLPMNMSVNPALAPEDAYVAMPFVGGSDISIRSGFSYSDIISSENGVKYFDTQKMISAFSGNNDVMAINANLQILAGGFYVSCDDFINITMSLRNHVATNLPDGMPSFLLDNPLESVNRTFEMGASQNMTSWIEVGVGYSRVINKNFRVGAKLKYLNGLAGIKNDNMSFTAYKNGAGYYQISGDYTIRAGNIGLEKGGMKFGVNSLFSNPGVSADIGLEYVSDDRRWMAMASVYDLGAIFWNAQNSTTLKVKNPGKVYDFTGFGRLQGLIDGKTNLGAMADSVFKEFSRTIGVDTIRGQQFSTMIPTRYHAMVEYALGPKFQHNVSLSFMGIAPVSRAFDYQLSAGYCYRSPNDRWQVMGNYTYRPRIPVAVGVGGMYTSKNFQVYLGIDNLLPIFGLKSAQSTSLQLGMSFFIR